LGGKWKGNINPPIDPKAIPPVGVLAVAAPPTVAEPSTVTTSGAACVGLPTPSTTKPKEFSGCTETEKSPSTKSLAIAGAGGTFGKATGTGTSVAAGGFKAVRVTWGSGDGAAAAGVSAGAGGWKKPEVRGMAAAGFVGGGGGTMRLEGTLPGMNGPGGLKGLKGPGSWRGRLLISKLDIVCRCAFGFRVLRFLGVS